MTKKLPKKDLEYFQQLLIEKRALATGDYASLSDPDSIHGQMGGGDSADKGSDAAEQEFALSILATEANVIREIDEALDRIEKGTYGVCEESGAAIGKARLAAIPWVRLSIECQRDAEDHS